MSVNAIIFYISIVMIFLCLLNYLMVHSEQAETFDTPSKGPKGTISLYYATSCGYCKNFLPEWEKFESTPPSNVRVQMFRCDASDLEEMCIAKVRGYPTVLLELDDGGEVEYDGPRSEQGLREFIKEKLG